MYYSKACDEKEKDGHHWVYNEYEGELAFMFETSAQGTLCLSVTLISTVHLSSYTRLGIRRPISLCVWPWKQRESSSLTTCWSEPTVLS